MGTRYGQKDEAEQEAGRIRGTRQKILEVLYWCGLVAIGVIALLNWIFGAPSGDWFKLAVEAFMLLIFVGLLNSMGVFDHHEELRIRTKETNQKLTAIEGTLGSRIDRIERTLELLMEHLEKFR